MYGLLVGVWVSFTCEIVIRFEGQKKVFIISNGKRCPANINHITTQYTTNNNSTTESCKYLFFVVIVIVLLIILHLIVVKSYCCRCCQRNHQQFIHSCVTFALVHVVRHFIFSSWSNQNDWHNSTDGQCSHSCLPVLFLVITAVISFFTDTPSHSFRPWIFPFLPLLAPPQILTAHSSSSTSACQYTECLYFSINNLSLNSSIWYCCSCCLSVTVFVCVCVYELMFSLFVVVVERHFVEENPVRVFVSSFLTQFSLF